MPFSQALHSKSSGVRYGELCMNCAAPASLVSKEPDSRKEKTAQIDQFLFHPQVGTCLGGSTGLQPGCVQYSMKSQVEMA